MLGEIYLFGNGVPKNTKIAIKYFRKGADLGHAHGQYMLANLLHEKSPVQAKIYLEKAAANGHDQARQVLDDYNRRYEATYSK